jgi:hypothetical protein
LTEEEIHDRRCRACDAVWDADATDSGGDVPYMQTVDSSALPIELDTDSVEFDQIPEETDAASPNQTVDAYDLPGTIDSDSVELPDLQPGGGAEGPPSYNQTIDASQLPASQDTDSVDGLPADAAAEPPTYKQTIDASQLPAGQDTDSVDGISLDGAEDPPAYNQTIDASQLPASQDSDSIDVDGLSEGGSEPPAYNQTIDASQLPASQDSDSVSVDGEPPSYTQTVDASQLPADLDTDSVDVSSPGGDQEAPTYNQTVDSDSLPGSPGLGGGGTDATVDSADFGPAKPGTVSDVAGGQTIDSQTIPGGVPGDGTVNAGGVNATVDSTDITGGEGGTVGARQVAQTYDSSVIADDPNQMDNMWGGDQNANATPGMTIKGREPAPEPGRQTLAISPRAFREVSTEQAFGGAADYDLMKKLGEGGMGVVFIGRQASIDRDVAIKMLKPNMSKDDNQRNKFLSEAVITGDLDHPNIVPIYDLGANDEGALFYAMKCVKGTPWDDCIGDKTLTENIDILLKTCDAVAFGHSRGIIHRDLKPENTMIGGFGEVLVMDWGLALPYGDTFEKSRSVTTQASMGGTPAYMAPEMATGPFDKMGPAADIYLLGAILYEIVTGLPPHRGKDVMKCLFAAAKNQIVPTEKTGELVDIALKAMSTNIEDRYATVQDFQAAIRSYQDHSESIALSTRAADELDKAKEADSYDAYNRARFGFEEALALWDGNDKATDGITQAKLAYATSALHKGDYDLGASLLDPADAQHADLAVQIDEARREREIKQQRAQKLKRVVITMAITGFLAAVIVSGVMYSLKSMADTQRQLAVDASEEAHRQEGIAKGEATKARKAEGEARVSEKKAKDQEVIAKGEATKARKAEGEARVSEKKAKDQREIAKGEATKARKAEGEARIAEQEAKDQRDKAEYETYIALIGLAAAKIDENAFGHARELLGQCKPELRNWEWGRLMHICKQSVKDFDVGAPVDAIDFAPDGKRFVTGGWNGNARVWDIMTGDTVDLPHGGMYVQAVAFSPVANQVATGSNDKQGYLRVWDVDFQEARIFAGHTDAVTSITYSRDGTKLLTTSFDNTAILWQVKTGKPIRVFKGHSWWVWDADFSNDESQIVTVSQDGTALVWSVEDGTKSAPFTGHQGPIYSAAFSPDGETVASGGYDKRVLLWRPEDIAPVDLSKVIAGDEIPPPKFRPLAGHTAAVRTVEFSSDGRLVLSAGHDNTLKVWHAEEAVHLKTLRGHDSWVRSCAFSPNGRWALSAGYDNHARLWNIDGYQEVRVLRGRVLEGHLDAIMAVSFSRDGFQIATGSRDRTAKIWDAKTGAEKVSLREGHLFLASDSAFFSDKKRLLTSAVDNTVRIWNVSEGVELLQLRNTGRAAAVAVSHDDRWIATGSDDPNGDNDNGDDNDDKIDNTRTAKLWNADTGELVHLLAGHSSEVTAVAFSRDDRYVYSGDSNGRGMLWDRQSGQPLKRLGVHTSQIASAYFLPDGERLLTASDDNTVEQWDIRKLAADAGSVVPIDSLRLGHPDSVTSLDVSEDGKRVLTSCLDGKIRLWDVDRAALIYELSAAGSEVSNATLSRDGLRALSVHADERVVRVWYLDTAAGGGDPKSEVYLDFNKLGGLVWSARFSDEGREILTVGGNEARLWNSRTEFVGKRELMSFSPHAAVASASFSPDGRSIVTASWDNSARIWNTTTGVAEKHLVGGHTSYVNSAVFSPQGEYVLTASDDRTAILWNPETREVVRTFDGHNGRVRYAVFSPDGARVLTASDDKTARVWNTDTGETVLELIGHEWGVLCAAFSADGRHVVTGSDDNSARLWDATTGKPLQTLAGHTAAVTSVSFSPDGERVLTASEDFTAKLWDANNGKEILNLRGHSQEVTSVTFSDDGRYALTGSRDGTAILWLATEWKPPVQGE